MPRSAIPATHPPRSSTTIVTTEGPASPGRTLMQTDRCSPSSPDRRGVIRDDARFAADPAGAPLRAGHIVTDVDTGDDGEQHGLEPAETTALPAARPAGGRPASPGWPLPQLATRRRRQQLHQTQIQDPDTALDGHPAAAHLPGAMQSPKCR